LIRLLEDDFLSESEIDVVRAVFESDSVNWTVAEDAGRAATGNALQLADHTEHRRPEVREMAELVAGRIFDRMVSEIGSELPAAESIRPQVFPVRMRGSRDHPAAQRPHRDHDDGKYPGLTCVYYPWAEALEGGRLTVHRPDGATLHVDPKSNRLCVMNGDTLHSVEPLLGGERWTVVTNFYWEDGD
jgi:hypothetical protein